MKPVLRTVVLAISLSSLVAPFQSAAHEDKAGSEKLGTVRFATSCSPAVQSQFERGVALLHSFWFSEGLKTFAAVAEADPGCAMAHWGSAMLRYGNPFTWPPAPAALTDGWAAVERAKAAQAKTQRERDYIGAIEAFYKDWDKVDHRTRALAYAKAMEQVAQRYPEDSEASVFYALALDVTALPSDKTYAHQLKAAAILEKVLAAQPDHPGVAHYLIHSYDFAPIAKQGLSAARRYAVIAPSAPHALHMPGHIFTRRGLWDESIDINARSAKVSESHFDSLHALDYLAYAYLQQARDSDAMRVLNEVKGIRKVAPEHFVTAYALAAIPARYALERGQWADAANVSPHPGEADFPWARFPQALAELVYARGLGAARVGDASGARKAVDKLKELRQTMIEAKVPYWPQRAEVQIKVASAWAAFAQGDKQEAVKLMREGADMEDASDKHPVTPAHVVPARELLGEMLLEIRQPAMALREFEASHQVEPNRFRGLLGAARAAELAGDVAKAEQYYSALLKLAAKSDGARPELVKAKQFLARKG
jgi:tetratricopeptide (TPR) repeat protein